ncbi:MAG: N-6 DNA methylase [Raoultibacter sp.]|jgi:hypothetical protein
MEEKDIDIQEARRVHQEKLKASSVSLLEKMKSSHPDEAAVLERLLHERQAGLRLRRLRDCAEINLDQTIKIPTSQFALRKGKYPYYLDGFKVIHIDDFTITGNRILVLSKGAVSTHEGALVAITVQGRFSVSPSFHVLHPADEDYLYLSIVVGAVDASRLIKGTRQAHSIDVLDLQMALLPWPEKDSRDAFCSVWSAAKEVDGGVFAKDFLDYWMLAAKNREFIDASPARKYNPDPTALPVLESREDYSERVLEVVEGLIDAMELSGDRVVDVVAETTSLEEMPAQKSADLCICFPPPNQGVWTKGRVNDTDPRWLFGAPPRNKANYAWIQQCLYFMGEHGSAILMLCNAPLHSEIGREKELRKEFAQSNLVDAVISLPGGLFADGRPPVSLVVLQKGRPKDAPVLFVDAQERGSDCGTDKRGLVIRALSDDAVRQIIDVFTRWKRKKGFRDEYGFCREAYMADIEAQQEELMPYAYVVPYPLPK